MNANQPKKGPAKEACLKQPHAKDKDNLNQHEKQSVLPSTSKNLHSIVAVGPEVPIDYLNSDE